MKNIFLLIIIFFSFFANGQSDIRQISCLGEIVKNTGNEQILSNSHDTGTVFTINENDKTITVKTATRFQGAFMDEFYYQDFIESPYARIYTCYRNGDREKSKYFISVLSDKMTLMTGDKIIESKIISDRILKHENYEDLSTEIPSERIGKINGTNVIFRKDHTTKSDIIGSFKNSGEEIKILGTYIEEKGQALISENFTFSINSTDYEFKKGKAVDLIDENNGYYTVSFKDKDLNEQRVKLKADYVSVSDYSKWYKVKRTNGLIGWVFGKYIAE